MVQFMFAFDSNLKPVVGQQVTLTSSNKAVADPRVNLLIQRALAGDADLVVKGNFSGEHRGAVMLPNGTFQTDKQQEAPLTEETVRSIANGPGQELTFTAVPPGSGERIGIDRDQDNVLDELDPAGRLDKDTYRMGEDLDKVQSKFKAIAEITSQFKDLP